MQRIVVKIALVAFLICAQFGPTSARAQGSAAVTPLAAVPVGTCSNDDRFTLVIHGGSVFWRGFHAPKIPYMQKIMDEARQRLAAGARAIDVVEAVIAGMENTGLFNAGKGAIANQAGNIELDASIMDGRDLQAGAVAAVRALRNPIRAARLVMDKSDHVMLVGPNADDFVRGQGGVVADPEYFLHGGLNFSDVPLPDDMRIADAGDGVESGRAGYLGIWAGVFLGDLNAILVVENIEGEKAEVIYAYGRHPIWGDGFHRRLEGVFVDGALQIQEPTDLGGFRMVYRLQPDDTLAMTATHPDLPGGEGSMKRLPAKPGGDHKGGTVGAAVRDRCGDLAAGTSTGGFDSKIPGRVGDSPIIGAGTYADNATAAISATGYGEFFMRHVVAYDITALMKYQDRSLDEAASHLIKQELRIKGLRGGVIGVDRDGNYVMTYNTEGMVRGVTSHELEPAIKIFER